MKAAQLVYGDEVGGAIVPEEEGDFLVQLARNVLTGARLSDLQTLFADDLQISHNPLGSMVTPSAVIAVPMTTWDEWLQKQGQIQLIQRKQRSQPALPVGQSSLF